MQRNERVAYKYSTTLRLGGGFAALVWRQVGSERAKIIWSEEFQSRNKAFSAARDRSFYLAIADRGAISVRYDGR